jgi:protein TonB
VPQTAVQTERYEAQILRYLESIKRYPSGREARQTRPAGTVTVWFDLSRAGRVLDAGIEKSSQSSLLDSEALKTVRTGNFPAYPEGVFANADKHRFSAHLSYELKTTE